VGNETGKSNTVGSANTYLGYQAGRNNDVESYETFIGYQAGLNTHSGSGNTFVGAQAGFKNDLGYGNVLIGVQAGYGDTTVSACYNTFVGNWCGRDNTTGCCIHFMVKKQELKIILVMIIHILAIMPVT